MKRGTRSSASLPRTRLMESAVVYTQSSLHIQTWEAWLQLHRGHRSQAQSGGSRMAVKPLETVIQTHLDPSQNVVQTWRQAGQGGSFSHALVGVRKPHSVLRLLRICTLLHSGQRSLDTSRSAASLLKQLCLS